MTHGTGFDNGHGSKLHVSPISGMIDDNLTSSFRSRRSDRQFGLPGRLIGDKVRHLKIPFRREHGSGQGPS